MKEKFRDIKFQKKNLIKLEKIAIILKEFKEKKIKVTLRQLYYQLVSKDIILNNKSEYNKLSDLLTHARYCGVIDWDAFEDRVRIPDIPLTFKDVNHLLDVAKKNYQLDRWNDQEYYIELWTEKDALSSVITPITNMYQIPFIVNRGYTSACSVYESSKRFIKHVGKTGVLLYLGDHDPSGLDMDRDIKARLKELGVDVNVIRIGLTEEQIKQYNLPENYAKTSDPRGKWYIEKFGPHSWEVDALRPDVLQELIKQNILSFLDVTRFEQVRKQEEQDIEQLKERIK